MATDETAPEPEIVSYKAMDSDMSCRGFKFEVGQTYTQGGKIKACESGFHACEYPLDVLQYYPAASRFFVVRQGGKIDRRDGDTKIASAKITIDAELKLPEFIAAAVKWVFDRATPENTDKATGNRGAASATGDGGAASATGYSGAASATGDSGAALASGFNGRVMGADGNALFLVYRDPQNGNILHAWAGIVGHDGIEADTWYSLDETGKPVRVAA